MSSLSTPTRISRGLIMPGIITKPTEESAGSVLSYGGLHTPPQSAHESRRPSLQYNALAGLPYSVTSSSFHSEPVTPVHGNDHAADIFVQRFSQSIDAKPGTNTHLNAPVSSSPLDVDSAQIAFGSSATYQGSIVETSAMHIHMSHSHGLDQFEAQVHSSPQSASAWKQPSDITNGYAAHQMCLASTLFQTPPGMDLSMSSMPSVFDDMVPSSDTANNSVSVSSAGPIQQYSAPSASYHQPQVIVPSQLSPHEDYSEQQFPEYKSPERGCRELATSFPCLSTSFDGYNMVGHSSPQDVYFPHSDDEDYVTMQTETFENPDQDFVSNGPVLRQRRRASRRVRKPGNRTQHCVHNSNGIQIRCEGKQGCCMQPRQNLQVASSKKPFRCTFVEKGKPCDARFDRSEHLKRHEGKHSLVRKYPCPLPGCHKRIGRPDNAGDHFKTHLRVKKPRRNAYFDWNQVHSAIWDNYEDPKVAKKLLDGLRRWINQGMPAASPKRNVRTR